jgi:ribosome-binding ATPase
MEVGIVGLPLSGKTTIYNALTHSNAQTASFSTGQYDIHTAVIDVPDPRVDALARMFSPRKTTYAKIQFNDVSGVAKGQAASAGLAPQVLTALSKCDALLLVVRAFANDDVLAPEGTIDPRRDLAALRFELIISDLAIVEHRIERIQAGLKKARANELPLLQHEQALMERFTQALEGEQTIADLELSDEDALLIRSFQFLTAKPMMVVVNTGEGDDSVLDLSWATQHRQTAALALRGSLEMEIAQLPPDEMALFLESYGIAEPSLNLMVRECYNLLGLMSFLTAGEDECRAWTVRRGAPAVEAAGAIHTDLARGFIRAEVLAFEDMIACKTLAEARKQGKLRLEGRDYVVQDGDILNIRFSV